MGALAIINEFPNSPARELLTYTVDNANAMCAYAPSPEGTWSETPNYWCVYSSPLVLRALPLLVHVD